MVQSAGDFLGSMNQMLQQGMLARMVGGMTGGGSTDQLAGGMMARGAAIGRPIMSAAQGMLGLDPMSLGLRAGQAAWGSGAGVLGAGLAGAGVAAGAGILGVGAHYVGNQMLTGAQQQLGLNQSMRQNFNFMNREGGMGFTNSQGFQIGGQLRGMAGEMGPTGEVASFGELSRLASNMGRMGMAQNVRTVKEFKENFKQMVDTLKVMAHDMGTSMEEAQKMMASMKSSGVFKSADQTRMSGGIRMGALSGGLAMSEMTGAANIGSQIVRSVGGLGRQGAFAGMKTMEQIGVAQRVGAISEEDIYNATGLQGAEGRQALAASQMQQSASFLSSGRGRRFLASVAGKNGQLNESAAMEYITGGMTTGRTMELANENLAGVGRANFIRNEGRLRGAALEKFGGLAQSMVYKQWLQSRGHDPNDMDDRSMLAFQRFSGMGRDEADLAIKQIQGMPEMLREMSQTGRKAEYADKLTAHRNTRGIEGMRRKFDAAREKVQGYLQEAGAKILEGATEGLETWFNGVMGVYVDVSTEGLDKVIQGMKLGGAGAERDYKTFFGKSKGTGSLTGSSKAMLENQKLQFAARGGTSNQDVVNFAKNNANFMKISALGSMGQSPEERLNGVRADLVEKAKTDPAAIKVLQEFDKGSTADKIALLQTMHEEGRVQNDLLGSLKAEKFGMEGGGARSMSEHQIALGRKLSGREQSGLSKAVGWLAEKGVAAGLSSLFGTDMSSAVSGVAASTSHGLESMFGISSQSRAMGAEFMDANNRKLLSAAFGDDEELAKSAQGKLADKIAGVRGGKKYDDLSDDEKGQIDLLAGGMLSSMHKEALVEYGKNGMDGKGVSEAIRNWRQTTGDTKSSDKEVMQKLSTMETAGKAAMSEQQGRDYDELVKTLDHETKATRDTAVNTGYMIPERDKSGKLTGKLSLRAETERGKLSKEGKLAVDLANRISEDGMSVSDRILMNQEAEERMAGLSGQELTAIARGQAGGQAAEIASHRSAAGDRFASWSKGKAGTAGAVAKSLGFDLSEDTVQAMSGKGAGKMTDAQKAALILKDAGVEDAGLLGGITKALGAKGAGKQSLEMERALRDPKTRKKIEESKEKKADAADPHLGMLRKMSASLDKIAGKLPPSAEEIGAAVGKSNAEGKGVKKDGT